MTVRDFFTAAPFWGLRPQVFPPAVYHDQQGAAASNFNSYRDIPGSYLLLLTDRYPSTVDEQAVHLDIDYPDVEHDLNRWLPLIKWFLAIPHFFVLVVLAILMLSAVIVAWFAILFTGRYPKGLFDFVVGIMRWGLRAQAYVILLVTD